MNTQYYNFSETAMNRKPNILSIIVMAIITGFVLVSGFFMSMMLLAVSAVLMPFVAIKLWLIKRQIDKNVEEIKTTTKENDDTLEAEYVIVDVTVDIDEKGK